MIIKKYIVNNMNEAMSRIRYELGKDAVIISQRKIRKPGIRGIFSSKIIEVTAAIDNKDDLKEDMKNSIDAIKQVMKFKEPSKIDSNQLTMNKENKNKSNKEEQKYEKTENDLLREMQEMKKIMTTIANKEEHEEKSQLELTLEENDINNTIIEDILDKINTIDDSMEEYEKVKRIINEETQISNTKMQGTVVLVGPTGVGKTTTIAKLAGRLSLIEKKKVGLITIDTYRIGAVEQLSTYADIMNIPFKVIISPKEMEEAINSMKDCDVVLIDTTGRSSKNKMQIAELNSFIQKAETDNIHLVISCTTKDKDINSIIEGYKSLDFNNVIITKLDETTTYGSILNILHYTKKPLSFVTTGQNVPDDIKKITCEEITNLILGEDFIC
ncbi:flagellar biosynthesis protein FlhF [Clostridium brassicae]|uniref:Flagellar biosynthesis protein FlhF n=1 Tax=Clostridium brassicae TaxID=2999072 RepID=A0ABT4DEK1_9CLOT|nr:flagellar biosynthesis protein FlhF [Clostridium brassicae]MCY6959616.1 flagellar biosynthesis protein FlhF [Clostridium brassicae]